MNLQDLLASINYKGKTSNIIVAVVADEEGLKSKIRNSDIPVSLIMKSLIVQEKLIFNEKMDHGKDILASKATQDDLNKKIDGDIIQEKAISALKVYMQNNFNQKDSNAICTEDEINDLIFELLEEFVSFELDNAFVDKLRSNDSVVKQFCTSIEKWIDVQENNHDVNSMSTFKLRGKDYGDKVLSLNFKKCGETMYRKLVSVIKEKTGIKD